MARATTAHLASGAVPALGTHQGKADLTRPSPLRVNLSEVPMGEREHWYFECMADAADQGDGKSSDR